MYLTATENHWSVDIETDDLDATVVWVMCAENIVTGEKVACKSYEEIRKFYNDRPNIVSVGHNFIKFDAPQLRRLVGVRLPVKSIVDTLVLSSLFSPGLAGGHSLDAWGERLKNKKQQFNDFSRYSEEMLKYCEQDVALTADLFRRLTQRMRKIGFTEQGCFIEHMAWEILRKQKENGFAFDAQKATGLLADLRDEQQRLEELIHVKFPPTLQPIKSYDKRQRADGSPTSNYLRHCEEYPVVTDTDNGGYTVYDYVGFNLGSPPQRVQKLLQLGWVPREFTKPSKTHPEGQPQPTRKGELSPSLAEFAETSGIEEIKLIAQWIAVTGRINMVSNWLDLYDPKTGCIHGNLWLANTLRYKHDKPNTANIPAVRVGPDEQPLRGAAGYWTYEARDCWTTRDPENRRLVGVDAKGIQLRVLAHYLNNPDFTEAILSEDPHAANQKRLGLPSRALTKTITYATLMGAGDARIASEAKVSLKEAKAAKKTFFEQIPELPALIERLQKEVEKTGRITLCDGSRIIVTKPHTVIPYLLQGDESRIMKLAAIYVDAAVRKEKTDVLKCGDIHDEWQSDVLQRHIDQYTEFCRRGFERAGRYFNYNLPIECDWKIGLTWAETH